MCLCRRWVFPAGLRVLFCLLLSSNLCFCGQLQLLLMFLSGFILANAFKPQTRPANNLPRQFSRKKKTFQKQLHCMPDEILMTRFGYKQEKRTVEVKKERSQIKTLPGRCLVVSGRTLFLSAAPKGQQGHVLDTAEGEHLNLQLGKFLLKPFQNHHETSCWLILTQSSC